MLNKFNIWQWSALDKLSVEKSNIFLSQFAMLAIIGAAISAVHDAFFESITTVLIDVFIVTIFLITFLLNEKGHHLKAKLIFVFVSPISMFVYAAILPKESGVYFIFFPIIMIIFLLFDKKDRVYQMLGLFFTISLLILLELTAYHPFGEEQLLQDISSTTSYFLNLFIAVFVTIFSLFSMEGLNQQIEKRRQEALKELNQKNQELQEINEELDQFVYSASHDLKAPLSSVLGLINIAKYEVTEETSLNYFDLIERRINKLNIFIKEVLAISRNARTETVKNKVILKEVIEGIIEQCQYMEGANTIDFAVEIDVRKPVTIDQYRFEIVLNNIISNAIKYQKDYSDKKQIRLKAYLRNDSLIVEVVDNGVGIKSTDLPKVFNMFYRGHEKSEGSGLGLYIVKTAVKKLKGEIKIDSTVGQGTQVTLSIPSIC